MNRDRGDAGVMLDHPAWVVADDGIAYRAVRAQASVWTLTVTNADIRLDQVIGSGGQPAVDTVDPAALTGRDAVVRQLRAAGPVVRLRNPDLWDALATSIIRQVIRAGHARRLYRSFCHAHGELVGTPAGDTWLFPTPETVLTLPTEEFTRLGLAFKRPVLLAAAEAYHTFGSRWRELDADHLLTEVQRVPRIGPWTAGVTLADVTNDYALYPYADLAVRTWVKQLAPGRTWPETEPEFARVWARLARDQLSEWTLLTLAWGVRHANGTNP